MEPETKSELEKLEETLKNMSKADFAEVAAANNISVPKKKDNRKGAIGKLKSLYSQGKYIIPGPAASGPASPVGFGLKFKKGRKSKDIEGKGFLGDLFRSAKNKIVEAVKSDPIGTAKKAFELAQKGIKGAQQAKAMATQMGIIKAKPEQAKEKGSGLKRKAGRPKKQVKGGDFIDDAIFKTVSPYVQKAKSFMEDPLTRQALGLYKEITGGKLKGKQTNFKQALEDYKKVQKNQKKNIRKRVLETM